jgi:hypothetical protein
MLPPKYFSLFAFGTVSILLLSSFSIWRIWLDSLDSEAQNKSFSRLVSQSMIVSDMLSDISDLRTACFRLIEYDNDNEENKDMLFHLQGEIVDTHAFLEKILALEFDYKYRVELESIVAMQDSLILYQRQALNTMLQSSANRDAAYYSQVRDIVMRQIDPQVQDIVDRLMDLQSTYKAEFFETSIAISKREKHGNLISTVVAVLTFTSGAIGLGLLLAAGKAAATGSKKT